ncbi:hypothetical protein [uncultured Sulfitobacter sp.]|jgi:hypothetical protein|uniref:hypothetical protein n=1 Tax=Sulfitobacter sp. SH22 TaxID=3421172 RepID=UPI0025D9A9DE|nr:hypothetical protein [uncultured Sulfitobacter sp.]
MTEIECDIAAQLGVLPDDVAGQSFQTSSAAGSSGSFLSYSEIFHSSVDATVSTMPRQLKFMLNSADDLEVRTFFILP